MAEEKVTEKPVVPAKKKSVVTTPKKVFGKTAVKSTRGTLDKKP